MKTFITKENLLVLFTIYLRYLLGIGFVYAFSWKTHGMMSANGTVEGNPIWASFLCIMNMKYLWMAVIYGQLVSGILLATQRFATLGAILMFPIIFCIVLMTWSVDFAGTKYITLLMLLAVTYLLIWDRKKLLPIISRNPVPVVTNSMEDERYWVGLGTILAAIALGHSWYNNVILCFAACFLTGVTGLILYWVTRTKNSNSR